MINKWVNKWALAGMAMFSMLSERAFAQTDPFETFNDKGQSAIEMMETPFIIIATIGLMVMAAMFATGRLQAHTFLRLAIAAVVFGAAPSVVAFLVE